MGIYHPTGEGDPSNIFGPGATVTEPGLQGGKMRQTRRPRKGSISNKQSLVRAAFATMARHWKENLTAAQRFRWYQDDRDLTKRNRDIVQRPPFLFWMHTQFPLYYTSMGIEPPATRRWKFDLINIQLLSATASTQQLHVYWGIGKTADIPCRSVMHVSQVPPDHVGDNNDWRYALWTKSIELSTEVVLPGHGSQSQDFPAVFPFAVGDRVAVFIRITHLKDPYPPLAEISHYSTTEPRTSLIVTAT